MTKDELLEQIRDSLHDKTLSMGMKLKEIKEWDSLGVVGIITLFDELFNAKLNADTIVNCSTIEDLINLAPKEQVKG